MAFSVNPNVFARGMEDQHRDVSDIPREQAASTALPPRVVVFDFGGVVGTVNKKRVSQLISQELGLSKEGVKDLLKRIKKWKGPMQKFWDEYAKGCARPMPDNWSERFDEQERVAIEGNPGTLKTIKELRSLGYTTALLSNTGKARARLMKLSGYDKEFDLSVLSCDIGAKKPDQRAYEIFLRQAQVPASQCLFVDDKPENIEVAQRMGFEAVLFTSSEDLRTEFIKRRILT
jgi:HAD superfamily hydrolase (TIGR01509 family)